MYIEVQLKQDGWPTVNGLYEANEAIYRALTPLRMLTKVVCLQVRMLGRTEDDFTSHAIRWQLKDIPHGTSKGWLWNM